VGEKIVFVSAKMVAGNSQSHPKAALLMRSYKPQLVGLFFAAIFS
jgi:hypothetical protein